MRARRGPASLTAALMVVSLVGVLGAPAGAVTVRRFVDVDIGYTGDDLEQVANSWDVSSTGRYVVFTTFASGVVPDGNWQVNDVYLRDMVAGRTTTVSLSYDGGHAGRSSGRPSLSDDARWVAFESDARNLVYPYSGHARNIFLRDMAAGVTTLVSVGRHGTPPDSWSDGAQLSADGRWVAFRSFAGNLVRGDDNGFGDVFVRDLASGTTRLISRAPDGSGANGVSFPTGISGDGRVVTFSSDATNLVAGSSAPGGEYIWSGGRIDPLGVGAVDVSVARGGGHVAFSTATDGLVPGDDDGLYDVFVRDLGTGQTTRLTVAADGHSWGASISGDGGLVAFHSDATNLGLSDDNGAQDVFVADVATGAVRQVSVDGNGGSWYPAMTADGSAVAFTTSATNLAPEGHLGLLLARLG